MRTKARSYKGYELTATQSEPKWDVGIYPSAPHLPWPNPNSQMFSDADVETAFKKAERQVDELLGALPRGAQKFWLRRMLATVNECAYTEWQ